ncbi:MAG: peptidoglycan-binding protein [Candidatus Terrybacteria bacterium]|nr:peptidoglycan-binding protein [Candidatus Terrybacteria bacterium]
MKNIKKLFIISLFLGILVAAGGFGYQAQAAGLTQIQIDAILGLLRSFGADAATVSNVQSALTGAPVVPPTPPPPPSTTPSTAAWCHDFYVNLKVEDSGSEVGALKTALIKDGFPINESLNFNEETVSAVIGFQEKYKDEILIPVGLQYGTGYVGASTRAKLNSLYGCLIPVPPPPPSEITIIPTPTPTPIIATTTPSITVLSPNGGEVFVQGQNNTISWESSNLPSNTTYVHLALISETAGEVGFINYTNTNDPILNCGSYLLSANGNYSWDGKTACKNSQKVNVSVGNYKINARLYSWPNTNNPGIEIALDSSDAAFSIAAATQSSIKPMIFRDILKVESVTPYDVANLGFGVYQVSAQYNLGSYHQGKWYEGLNPGISGPVWVEFSWPNRPDTDVLLQDENGLSRKIYLPSAGANTTGNPWYYWIAEDGSSYYAHTSHGPSWPNLSSSEALKLEHLAQKAATTTTPSITVLSPNGGESWSVGSTQTIRWTSQNLPSGSNYQFSIDLRKNDVNIRTLFISTENDGTQQWIVPDIVSSGIETGLKIRLSLYVVGTAKPLYYDDSDAAFSIAAAGPATGTVTIASPNGGETYVQGSTYNINWTNFGFGSDAWAQIQLRNSTDPSKMVSLIVNSVPATANTGSTYSWTVPNTIPAGKYLIWVTMGSGLDSTGNRVLGSDYSDAAFSIVATTTSGLGAVPASTQTASALGPLLEAINKLIELLKK